MSFFKKLLVVATFCLFCFYNVHSTNVVDSLKNLLSKANSDTSKINLYIEIGVELRLSNEKEALEYLMKAKNKADTINNLSGEIRAEYYLGYHFLYKKDYIKSLREFNNSLAKQESSGHEGMMAKTYLGLGSSYMYQGNFEKAELSYNKGLEITVKLNKEEMHGHILKNMGILYAFQGKYKQSIDYFQKATESYRQADILKGTADCYTNIGVVYNYMGEHVKSIEYQIKAVNVYRQLNSKADLATALNNLGVSYDDINQYNDAINCYAEALTLRMQIDDNKGISSCYNNIGEVYRDKADYAKAIEYYEKSLNIDKQLNDLEGMAICQLNIGGIHYLQNNLEKANKYYGEALKNANSVSEKRIIANVLNAIGELLLKQKKYKQALVKFNEALDISIEIGEQSEEAKSDFFIGEVYKNTGEYPKAIKSYNKALKVHNNLGEEGEVSTDKIKIGESWLKMGYVSKAIDYLYSGLEKAKKLGIKQNVKMAAGILMKAYEQKNDFKSAYKYSQLFRVMYDSIYTLESQKQIHIVENRFEIERKEAEIELQKAKLEKQDAILKHKAFVQEALIGGIVSILIIVVIVVIAYLRIRKAKSLISLQNCEIEEKNEELSQGNEELRATVETVNEQKYEIERTTKELKDSINYAKNIQKAVLPKTHLISSEIEENFVLYKPKDIVSGDFYWTTEISGRVIIAAADCTGHGVPGAFMSMLGISFLNDIVNKEYITHTGVILRRLRKEVIHALNQKGVIGEQRDGMDMAICSIDFKKMELQFSGAHNPLYIIRSKETEPIAEVNAVQAENYILYEMKGDHMPIAQYEKMDRFSDKKIKIFKGDQIYLFSDGFIDQFGGADGKRFKSRPFKEVLLFNCELPMESQKCVLEKTLTKWQGRNEQIDDIMVMGFKV